MGKKRRVRQPSGIGKKRRVQVSGKERKGRPSLATGKRKILGLGKKVEAHRNRHIGGGGVPGDLRRRIREGHRGWSIRDDSTETGHWGRLVGWLRVVRVKADECRAIQREKGSGLRTRQYRYSEYPFGISVKFQFLIFNHANNHIWSYSCQFQILMVNIYIQTSYKFFFMGRIQF